MDAGRVDVEGMLRTGQRLAVNAAMVPITAGFILLGAGVVLSQALVEQVRRLLPTRGEDHDIRPPSVPSG